VDPKPDGFGEITQVAQQNQQHREMEYPAKQPGPLVGLEQALEEDDFLRKTSNDARFVTGAGVVGIFSGAGARA